MIDVLPAQCIAMMRAMQGVLDAVELHADARARELLDACPEVAQQRFSLPPLDVAADGIVKDRTQQIFGIDVEGLKPGQEATLDRDALGYPVASLSDLSGIMGAWHHRLDVTGTPSSGP